MNYRQRQMARHALGLGDGRKQSYRNRYYVPKGTLDWDEWSDMLRHGFANYIPSSNEVDFFWLTREGATAVLLPRETLCPEDFPPLKATP